MSNNTQLTNTVDPIFEAMFKKFSNQVKKDGIIEEVRKRRYYEKPSETKRLAQKSRIRHAR